MGMGLIPGQGTKIPQALQQEKILELHIPYAYGIWTNNVKAMEGKIADSLVSFWGFKVWIISFLNTKFWKEVLLELTKSQTE